MNNRREMMPIKAPNIFIDVTMGLSI